jgi:murein L,D-transpeptidase YcbB/YkuD
MPMWLRLLILSLAALLPVGPALAQSAPLRVDLNIPALRLVVFEGDKVLRTYPVAVGKPGHDTPTGKFEISRAEWNPWWRPPASEWARGEKVTPPGPNNPMGRVKLFFLPLYFIHGTPDSGSIGTPASHGCVRMRNADVIALGRLLHERAGGVSSAEIDRILARSGTTRAVPFRSAIELVVRYDPIEVDNGVVRVYPDIYKYNAIHSEAVYQALIRAGYEPGSVKSDDVRRLVTRALAARSSFSVPLEEAFGSELATAAAATALR